jgi:hypothetical protein
MKNNKYYNDLINEGFSEKTLSSLSEKQLQKLHSKIVKEATYEVSSDDIDQIKDKVGDNDTVKVTEEDLEESEDSYQDADGPDTHLDTLHSDEVSDNRVDTVDGKDRGVKFVKDGKQSDAVSKSGHTGFAQPGEKAKIGGTHKVNTKFVDSSNPQSIGENKTTKADIIKHIQKLVKESLDSKTDTLPSFMDIDMFDGKLGDFMSGGAPVETPVKPTTTPGTKPGKPIVKPSVKPRPKAMMEESGKEIVITQDMMDMLHSDGTCDCSGVTLVYKKEGDLSENGRTFAGGDETKGGLPKQRGSKHPKMKK